MSHADQMLTAVQRQALAEFASRGGEAHVNLRRDGFEDFAASKAIALVIAKAAEVEGNRLKLTTLGRMLTGDGPQ